MLQRDKKTSHSIWQDMIYSHNKKCQKILQEEEKEYSNANLRWS